MNLYLNRAALFLCFLILAASCKKTPVKKNTIPPPAAADVYVAGISSDTAIYWKNGTAAGLGANSVFANSIFVSGTDVYIAGGQFLNGNYVAALWKNGNVTLLANQNLSPSSYANSVIVSGGDVYVAGDTYNNGNVATYWKNQLPVYVGQVNSTANSIYVSGGNVYVCGASPFRFNTVLQNAATVWENGIPQVLTATGDAGYAESVFVSGSDVYVAGFKYTVGGSGNRTAAYWKNGVITELSTNNAFASSIYVSGTDVYAAGNEVVNGVDEATYWKNGVATHLAPGKISYGSSITVSGNDVYIAGDVNNTSNTAPVATVWKNGTATTLKSNYSIAYGLFVK